MLRPFLCLLLAFCCAGPVRAMDVNDKGDPGLAVAPNANPVMKKGDPGLTVTSLAPDSTLCRALVKHTPDASVNYQPGTDARGKPTPPADVPGAPQMEFPKTTVIPLTVSLAKVLNLNTAQY